MYYKYYGFHDWFNDRNTLEQAALYTFGLPITIATYPAAAIFAGLTGLGIDNSRDIYEPDVHFQTVSYTLHYLVFPAVAISAIANHLAPVATASAALSLKTLASTSLVNATTSLAPLLSSMQSIAVGSLASIKASALAGVAAAQGSAAALAATAQTAITGALGASQAAITGIGASAQAGVASFGSAIGGAKSSMVATASALNPASMAGIGILLGATAVFLGAATVIRINHMLDGKEDSIRKSPHFLQQFAFNRAVNTQNTKALAAFINVLGADKCLPAILDYKKDNKYRNYSQDLVDYTLRDIFKGVRDKDAILDYGLTSRYGPVIFTNILPYISRDNNLLKKFGETSLIARNMNVSKILSEWSKSDTFSSFDRVDKLSKLALVRDSREERVLEDFLTEARYDYLGAESRYFVLELLEQNKFNEEQLKTVINLQTYGYPYSRYDDEIVPAIASKHPKIFKEWVYKMDYDISSIHLESYYYLSVDLRKYFDVHKELISEYSPSRAFIANMKGLNTEDKKGVLEKATRMGKRAFIDVIQKEFGAEIEPVLSAPATVATNKVDIVEDNSKKMQEFLGLLDSEEFSQIAYKFSTLNEVPDNLSHEQQFKILYGIILHYFYNDKLIDKLINQYPDLAHNQEVLDLAYEQDHVYLFQKVMMGPDAKWAKADIEEALNQSADSRDSKILKEVLGVSSPDFAEILTDTDLGFKLVGVALNRPEIKTLICTHIKESEFDRMAAIVRLRNSVPYYSSPTNLSIFFDQNFNLRARLGDKIGIASALDLLPEAERAEFIKNTTKEFMSNAYNSDNIASWNKEIVTDIAQILEYGLKNNIVSLTDFELRDASKLISAMTEAGAEIPDGLRDQLVLKGCDIPISKGMRDAIEYADKNCGDKTRVHYFLEYIEQHAKENPDVAKLFAKPMSVQAAKFLMAFELSGPGSHSVGQHRGNIMMDMLDAINSALNMPKGRETKIEDIAKELNDIIADLKSDFRGTATVYSTTIFESLKPYIETIMNADKSVQHNLYNLLDVTWEKVEKLERVEEHKVRTSVCSDIAKQTEKIIDQMVAQHAGEVGVLAK